MFKTVFSRILLMFLVVIIGAFSVLGVIITVIFRAQFEADKKRALEGEAKKINEIVEEKYYFEEKRNIAREELKVIARQYKASIMILDRNGTSITVMDEYSYNEWEGQENAASVNPYLSRVLVGEIIYTRGFFGDFFQEEVMTVGRPLTIDGNIEGGIFIHIKMGDIDQAIKSMATNILLGVLVVTAFAVIMVTLAARGISRPLVEINRIVQRYGKGDFTERARVRGRDEVAQLAERVNRMADDLENLEVLRKSFVSNVSHELKSPLASMRGFLQGMLDTTVPDEQREEVLGIVLEETNRLNKLINDLLDLAKIESGNFPIHITSFDINELIRKTLISFETQIEAKRLSVKVQFNQEYGFVFADRDRMAQVLRNLLDNAIKFAQEGGDLAVRTSFGRTEAYIGIRNSGAGIAPDRLEHIWERFYTVDEAHTPGVSGTGLGLSIVKRILDQHSSRIHVSSTLHKGTLFVFTLRRAPAERKGA